MAATFPAQILIATIVLLFWAATFTYGFPATLTLERAFPRNGKSLRELKAMDNARHRRLFAPSAKDIDIPLGGRYNPLSALYYMKVQLGSPPKEFHVHFDTGSFLLWVNCAPCIGCPTKTTFNFTLNSFDPEKSSTYKPMTCSDKICTKYDKSISVCSNGRCTYSSRYVDSTVSAGYYVTDLIHFATATSNVSSPVLFGCTNNMSDPIAASTGVAVDGIFGFSQAPISVISQLSSKGLLPKVFSHCLKGDEQGGGTLVIGDIAEPNLVYTPLISEVSYTVQMQSIDVNGRRVPINSKAFDKSHGRGRTLVDSGASVVFLPDDILNPLVKAITDVAGKSNSSSYIFEETQCFKIGNSISQVFPEVRLNFAGGGSMDLRPQDYLISQKNSTGEEGWCLGFATNPAKNELQSFIAVGDSALRDKLVVYDFGRQRVGWADYDCSKMVPKKQNSDLEMAPTKNNLGSKPTEFV